MSDQNDFSKFTKSIKSTAEEVGALVLDTYVDVSEKAGALQAALDLDELVKAIRHVKPTIVYVSEGCLDLESEIEELANGENGADDEDTGSSNVQAVEQLRKKWRKRDGEPCLAIAAIVADGVLLTSVSRPSWRNDFDAELEVLQEETGGLEFDEGFALSEREMAEVKEKAIALAEHASFNSGRTSFEKRAFLAEHIFPGTKPKLLQAITRRAENIDWLTKSGFKA